MEYSNQSIPVPFVEVLKVMGINPKRLSRLTQGERIRILKDYYLKRNNLPIKNL